MKKSNLPKVGTIIPPIMLVGSIISSNLQQALVDKLISPLPFETPEQHCEEFPPSDYFGLNRVNGIFSATGTNPVMVFGENKSKLYSY